MYLELSGWPGGRQVDGSIGALDALDMVMQSSKVRQAQSTGKLTVLFDSGIRTGSDILKALALGAQAVLGRPRHFFFRAGFSLSLLLQSVGCSCMASPSLERRV